MKKLAVLTLLFVGIFTFGVLTDKASADGTETLGPPSIAIATGSGIIAAGTGLETQPGTIDINVPGTVVQVLLYWSAGAVGLNPGDDTITLNATSITGTIIGGPTFFYDPFYFSAYRADITALGLVSSGPNSLTVSDMDFGGGENNGAGLLVIYDDGTNDVSVDIRDGIDMAAFRRDPPIKETIPQTFFFSPSEVERTSSLCMFFGSVSFGTLRPNEIVISFDVGDTISLINLLGSNDGPQWDTLNLPITIPIDASEMTVHPISTPTFDPQGASFSWVGAGLHIDPPSDDGLGCRVTGGGHDTAGLDLDGVSWDGTLAWKKGAGDGGGGKGGNKGKGNNTTEAGATESENPHEYTFGGQAGANTALQPQSKGEWTHHQKKGPEGVFTFHAGTASAPEGTEIDLIQCSDPDYCNPARPAPAKQINFVGVGSFRNLRKPSAAFSVVVPGETLHWFEVHIEDLGEPGRRGLQPEPIPGCPPQGSDGGLADCDCPDYYRISIYADETGAGDPIYYVEGYIDGGNLQIHPLTGYDTN